MLKLLVCQNEKFGAQIQKHVKELVGHELNPALYPILFDQIKVCVDKFFDPSGQVMKLDLWKIHDLGHVIADTVLVDFIVHAHVHTFLWKY